MKALESRDIRRERWLAGSGTKLGRAPKVRRYDGLRFAGENLWWLNGRPIMGEHGSAWWLHPAGSRRFRSPRSAPAADKLDYDFTRASDDVKDRNDYWDLDAEMKQETCIWLKKPKKRAACWSGLLLEFLWNVCTNVSVLQRFYTPIHIYIYIYIVALVIIINL